MLSAEDEWLRAHRGTIDEKIGRGLNQLDRGEGIPGERKNPPSFVSAYLLSPEADEDVWNI